MSVLIVVEKPRRWPLDLPQVDVVSARDYLVDSSYSDMKGATVYNLCRLMGYQTLGYYVSLLATARGHRPLPSVATLQDLRLDPILRIAADEANDLMQHALADLKSDKFTLSIYFGRNMTKRYDRLCALLFNQFPAPFLRADFAWKDQWKLERVRAIGSGEIPESHRWFVIEQANEFFAHPRRGSRSSRSARYDMAILTDPAEPNPPSDAPALKRFIRAAKRLGISAELIEKDEYGRIAEYDALFIRATTAVNHYTYRFARRAAAEGLVVIDDPESVLRCTNKVYQAELFSRHNIATPRTLIFNEDRAALIAEEIGFPCVLKKPDSSFSQGVTLASDADDLKQKLESVLENTELAVVQEFVPSDFDWRIGVLDGEALYACKYFMVPGHWQIQREHRAGGKQMGGWETVPLREAPAKAVRLAIKAATLIGDGLYGVDVKEISGRFLVMEINDNPSIESGVEDAVIGEHLYESVMRWFLERLEQRGRRGAML